MSRWPPSSPGSPPSRRSRSSTARPRRRWTARSSCTCPTGGCAGAAGPSTRRAAAPAGSEPAPNSSPRAPMSQAVGRMGEVSEREGAGDDIPQRRVARTARLASLPLGVAGRATVGFGRRMTGRSADEVTADLQAKTAEQLFTVLGELKGGAMKLGQALSVFEAALPEESAAPYREALTKLQEAAPPMPAGTVHKGLDEQFGKRWPDRFREFDDVPAAAASIGQVHRAVWGDGREVAVKLQYPGAGPALMADLTQLTRLAWLFARMSPGLDVKPLLAELRERVLEELDYTLEADAQRAFAAAFADDPQIAVPRVVASAPKAVVSEWMDGRQLSSIISSGTKAERDEAGTLLSLLHLSAPTRAGLLHADPHPGNFRML